MKIIVLTGNQIRHKYYANFLSEKLEVIGLITEPHADYFKLQRDSSPLVKHHFKNLKQYEQGYFGQYDSYPSCEHLKIDASRINDDEYIEWAKSLNPDYILLYGTEILNNKWCNTFENKIINLHLGASPTYRGSATLFWPFYNDDLDNLGTTAHLATTEVDGGKILKVIKNKISYNDNYYDITSKLIKKSMHEIPNILKKYDSGKIIPAIQNKSNQKFYYRKKDFTEECLRIVMEKYYYEK